MEGLDDNNLWQCWAFRLDRSMLATSEAQLSHLLRLVVTNPMARPTLVRCVL